MLRHRLPAGAAAAALIGAPLLGLAAACAWPPLRSGERAQIAAIAAQPGRWYTFTLLILLSSFLLVPAVLALMRLLGQTRPAWLAQPAEVIQWGRTGSEHSKISIANEIPGSLTGSQRPQAQGAAGYYIQANESGESRRAAGRARALKALGLAPGQLVDRDACDLPFGQRKAPDGAPLSRSPANGRTAADIYTRLLAAEPHAAAERRRELRIEAAKQARQGPLLFDLTISLSKSISIFHASLGENGRLARQGGDPAGDQYWSALCRRGRRHDLAGGPGGFDYFQRAAGYTRTGRTTPGAPECGTERCWRGNRLHEPTRKGISSSL